MNTDINQITERIIGCVFRVSNVLGCGFLEKVYENALIIELRKAVLEAEAQKPITVYYDGHVVGEYTADIVVNSAVIVELKAVQALDEIHEAQCLNYLKASGLAVCLLVNFGRPKVQLKRLMGRPAADRGE